jgi:formylglycine-generating enzyme required for sulfatase activity
LPGDYTYRLPTEAEWEFACRAGTASRFSHGDDVVRPALPEFAWFGDNSDSTPHPVGTKLPNPWGLHDMHGNVLEWCLDPWQGSLRGGTATNTTPLPEGTLRVARGGSWLYPARAARSANRDSYGVLNRCSDLGFRVVLVRNPESPAAR